MEVLIALAILGIGMLAIISTAGTSTRTALELKQRTLAHWVAMNEATRLRAAPGWPDTGKRDGAEDMAGETWRWTAKITKTVDPGLRRADISVALDRAPDDTVASLIVFLGKPSRSQEQQNNANTGANNDARGNPATSDGSG